MKTRETNPQRSRLVKEIIAEYQPKDIMELQDVLKDSSKKRRKYAPNKKKPPQRREPTRTTS